MLGLGLNKAEHRALMKTLFRSHRMRTVIHVHDENEDVISSLTHPVNKILGGEVQVDTTADISRSLSVTLLDPQRKLRIEHGSPAHGAIYANRFISAHYEVFVGEEIDDWFPIPIFWGPLTHFERSGNEVTLEAQGKESLLLNPYLTVKGYTIKKGSRLDEAILEVGHHAGELRFRLPDLPHKLKRGYIVHQQAEPWKVITGGRNVPFTLVKRHKQGKQGHHKAPPRQKEAGLLAHDKDDLFAFYNGRGQLCVRERSRDPVFAFRTDRHITTEPSVSFDATEFRNYVHVSGGGPRGKKRKSGHAMLHGSHPLSPKSLARNGRERYLATFMEVTGLDSDQECRRRAEKTLKRQSQEGVEVSFETLPVPMLEEDDKISVITDEYKLSFHVKQFTIPLTSDGTMSVGYNKKVKPRRKHRGRQHDPRHGQAGPSRGGRGAGHRGSGQGHHGHNQSNHRHRNNN